MNPTERRLADDAFTLAQRLTTLHHRLTDTPSYRPYVNSAMLRHDVHELLSDAQHCLNRFLDATEKPIGGPNIDDIKDVGIGPINTNLPPDATVEEIEESDRQILEAVDEPHRRRKPKVLTDRAVQGSGLPYEDDGPVADQGPDPIDPGLMMPDRTGGDDTSLRIHHANCDENHRNSEPCNSNL